MSQDLKEILNQLSNLEAEKAKSRKSAANLENSIQNNDPKTKNDRHSQQVQIIKLPHPSEIIENSEEGKNKLKAKSFKVLFWIHMLKSFLPLVKTMFMFFLIFSVPIVLFIALLL